MRYRFPYVGADFRKSTRQPGIQRILRDHGYGWCITRYACLLPQLTPGTYSASAGSGWVGLGTWFRAEVVYPSKDGHPRRHYPDLAYRIELRWSAATCYRYAKPATIKRSPGVKSVAACARPYVVKFECSLYSRWIKLYIIIHYRRIDNTALDVAISAANMHVSRST